LQIRRKKGTINQQQWLGQQQPAAAVAVAVEQNCGTATNKSGDTTVLAVEHGPEHSDSNTVQSTATATKK